ncbi:MAG TPA: DNA cytosine methyltransferase [Puia sp.]|nr:DNA cytosine methyltransferase [Puia sp.]
MGYIDKLNKLLKPKKKYPIKVLDLFAGCGGLGLGFEAFGFETFGYEMNQDAAKSYERNLGSPCETIQLSDNYNFPKADIIIGGPPCQPFSVSGKQKGSKDSRNGIPIFIEAVKQTQPKLFILENVPGLVYSNKEYFKSLIKTFQGLGYLIEYNIVNAVNYRVPQKRERLIIVGHKSKFYFPSPFIKRINVSDAIGELMYMVSADSKFLTIAMDEYIARYEKASACSNPRDLYPDKPSRTLTCKNLAGATGDMLRIALKNGRRRRLTVQEAARLQSFPDWFVFEGSESSQFNQIGNAVPPLLAYFLAKEVYKSYLRKPKSSKTIAEINSKTNRGIALLGDKKSYKKAV